MHHSRGVDVDGDHNDTHTQCTQINSTECVIFLITTVVTWRVCAVIIFITTPPCVVIIIVTLNLVCVPSYSVASLSPSSPYQCGGIAITTLYVSMCCRCHHFASAVTRTHSGADDNHNDKIRWCSEDNWRRQRQHTPGDSNDDSIETYKVVAVVTTT